MSEAALGLVLRGDRQSKSAYEKLQTRAVNTMSASRTGGAESSKTTEVPVQDSAFGKVLSRAASIFKPTIGPRGGRYDSMATTVAKSAARTIGGQVGREIVRGVLGGFLGSGGRRR